MSSNWQGTGFSRQQEPLLSLQQTKFGHLAVSFCLRDQHAVIKFGYRDLLLHSFCCPTSSGVLRYLGFGEHFFPFQHKEIARGDIPSACPPPVADLHTKHSNRLVNVSASFSHLIRG